MIPVRLKIQGLYSYQGPQEIDFGPLLEAGLFGIFGGVGSGKSTILEAMTFALYGQTERLNKSGDDRLYNMMNLQSSDFLVDFECLAGPQNQRYRFVVKAKRNRKRFEDVPKAEKNIYLWMEEEWKPLQENTSGEQIIGLSYDNFRRTIIIPQGRFQDFIELKGQERTAMMKEIFQLEKFDLAGPTAKLQQENNQKISVLTGQLVGLEEVDPQRLESLRQEEKLQKAQLDELSKEHQNYQLVYETLKQMALWKSQETLLSERKERLVEQEGDIRVLSEQIQTYEHVQSHYQADVIQWRSCQAQQAHFSSQWLQAQAHLQVVETQYLNVQQQKENWQTRRLEGESHQQALLQWQTEETLWQIQEQWMVVKQQKEALENQLTHFIQREQERQLQRQRFIQQIESLHREIHPDFFEIATQVRQWHQVRQSILQQKEVLRNEAERIKSQVTEATQRVTQAKEKLHSFGADVEALYRRERQKLEEALTQWHVHQSWSHLVTHLQDGTPCPVCGSVEHPAPASLGEVPARSPEEILKKRQALDDRYQQFKQSEKELEVAQSTQVPLEAQKLEVIEKWENNKVQAESWLNSFPKVDPTWQDESIFGVWEKRQRELRTHLEALQQQLRQLENETQNDQQQKVALEQQVAEAQRQEHGHSVLWTAQRNQLTQEPQAKSILEAQQKQAQIQLAIRQEEEAYQAFEHSFQETTAQYQAAQQRVSQWKELAEQEQQKSEQWQIALEVRCQQDPAIQTFDFLQAALQLFSPETLSLARAKRDVYQQEKIKWEEAYQQWLLQGQAYEGLSYQADQLQLAHQALQDIQAKMDETKGILGGLQQKRTDLERLLVEKEDLIAQKATLELRKKELDTLERLFRGQGFVNFVSRIFLEQLCAVANQRFERMTRGQLQLKIGADNTFWVIDRLHGGRERLLKTLSGGQKFQASLALALALADGIQQRLQLDQHFFFIDEGFGSLDKESLQVVFETLTSLRKEKRRVGVISHVEDLQQEIQTYLQIKRLDTGSHIIKSWET